MESLADVAGPALDRQSHGYGLLRSWQSRRVFGPLGLQVRRNRAGYVAFLLLYQVLCSWASLTGYAQHVLGTGRRWK